MRNKEDFQWISWKIPGKEQTDNIFWKLCKCWQMYFLPSHKNSLLYCVMSVQYRDQSIRDFVAAQDPTKKIQKPLFGKNIWTKEEP